jgi:predicted SnoaL-like aldol condensation-catalyzing enzyme
MPAADAAANKALVRKAITELFINRDLTAVARYWGDTYVQHNPGAPNGRDGLLGLVKSLGPAFKYQVGMILADGDLVAVHGRYTGFGPKPMVAVDLFRVKDGKLVEHWDVIQEEVAAAETKSGNPMFSSA